MAEAMIDDIKKLLDGDFGDDRILKDIYRACKNGEVISNYERKYVRDLTERYLRTNPLEDASSPAPDKGRVSRRHTAGEGKSPRRRALLAHTGRIHRPHRADPRHRDHTWSL